MKAGPLKNLKFYTLRKWKWFRHWNFVFWRKHLFSTYTIYEVSRLFFKRARKRCGSCSMKVWNLLHIRCKSTLVLKVIQTDKIHTPWLSLFMFCLETAMVTFYQTLKHDFYVEFSKTCVPIKIAFEDFKVLMNVIQPHRMVIFDYQIDYCLLSFHSKM